MLKLVQEARVVPLRMAASGGSGYVAPGQANCAGSSTRVKSCVEGGARFVKILIVDDHPLFRDGMKYLLLKLSEDLDLREAEDCESAVVITRDSEFDLVLLDLKMPGSAGLDALRAFRAACPATPVVVLSGEGTPALVRGAIDEGAMGYIPKSSTHAVLIEALRRVLGGGVYLPREALSGAQDGNGDDAPDQSVAGLTPRQMDVLRGLIHGKPNKLIARDLDVSEHTVKAHLAVVYTALGAHNRTEAVYKAAQLGMPLV